MFSPLSGIFPANFDPGQPWPGQAGLAARPRLPRFFYPLASPAKARPLAVLTPAFRPGFDPGLPRSGQAPDARVNFSKYFIIEPIWARYEKIPNFLTNAYFFFKNQTFSLKILDLETQDQGGHAYSMATAF